MRILTKLSFDDFAHARQNESFTLFLISLNRISVHFLTGR